MESIINALKTMSVPFIEILLDVARSFIGKTVELLIEYANTLIVRLKAQLRIA